MGWKEKINEFVEDNDNVPRKSQFNSDYARINERLKYEKKE